MIGFLIGLFIGGFAGVAVMAVMNVASESDKRTEEQNRSAEA